MKIDFKKIAGKAIYYFVRLTFILTRVLPVKWAYGLCSFLVFIGMRIDWGRKRIALSNLKIVFPGRTEEELKSILSESLTNMMKNYYEMAYVINGKFREDEILQMVSANGLENLDKVIEDNRGAILFSGHFGNFPIMFTWLALKGYPIAAVYKDSRYFPENYLGNLMRGLKVSPIRFKSDAQVTVEILRALRDKKIVLMLNDQSHPHGIYINFFGKSVPSPAGPALLAKRAKVPVIPAYVYRDSQNHHHVEIRPEINLKPEEDNEKFLLTNTQLMIDWIAEILLKHPAEWLWLHNRWKRAKTENAPAEQKVN